MQWNVVKVCHFGEAQCLTAVVGTMQCVGAWCVVRGKWCVVRRGAWCAALIGGSEWRCVAVRGSVQCAVVGW